MKILCYVVVFAMAFAGGWFGHHYWENHQAVAAKCPCCTHCACNKADCKGSCCADKKCCTDCGCTDAGCCAAPGRCNKK